MNNKKIIPLRKNIKDIIGYFNSYKIIFDDDSFIFLDKPIFKKALKGGIK